MANSTLARVQVPTPARRTWTVQHFLCSVAVVFLLWEAWTIVAWVASGPHPITAFDSRGSAAWNAARAYEGVMVVVAIVVLTYVVRGCRRAGRLTFDAMLCIAAALAYWLDPLLNFYQPAYLYSANWTNLGNWCGHAPLVVNPECGRVPEPIIFIGLMYAVGFPAAAIVACGIARAARNRWPDITNGRILLLFAVCGVVFNTVMETPLLLLRLWSYASFPDTLSIFLGRARLPWAYAIPASVLAFGALGALRFLKDDRDRTLFERGLDNLSPARRTLVSLFSVIGFMQLLVLAGVALLWVFGPYASPWKPMPAHLVNEVCDTPGFANTRYGPCPGSPEYRMPVRRLGSGG